MVDCFSRPVATRSRLSSLAAAVTVAVSLWAGPSLAKDPFRTSNPRAISDRTEAAFVALFKQGDYRSAETLLQRSEPTEPLTYALRASLTYATWQGESDSQKRQALAGEFLTNATQTRESAQQLLQRDPLRGNLYTGVGYFLEAAHALGTQGMVRGTPAALGKLQQVFNSLDAAEAIDAKDPELNLVKGFMDLMLSVNINLPLSSPAQAIERLEKYASPAYVSYRGLALGYRDLKQPDRAMQAIERALAAAPNNPELLYLKAQILVNQGKHRDSIPLFEKALTKQNQLPTALTAQIGRELDRAKRRSATGG